MRDTTKRLAEEMRSQFGTPVRDHGKSFVNGDDPADQIIREVRMANKMTAPTHGPRPAPGTNVSRDCRSDALGSLPWWLTEQGFVDWWHANVEPEQPEPGRPLRDLGMTTAEAVRWEIARQAEMMRVPNARVA